MFQILIWTKKDCRPKPSPAGKGDRRAVDEESIWPPNKRIQDVLLSRFHEVSASTVRAVQGMISSSVAFRATFPAGEGLWSSHLYRS